MTSKSSAKSHLSANLPFCGNNLGSKVDKYALFNKCIGFHDAMPNAFITNVLFVVCCRRDFIATWNLVEAALFEGLPFHNYPLIRRRIIEFKHKMLNYCLSKIMLFEVFYICHCMSLNVSKRYLKSSPKTG